jgi:metal-dependent amidase/aminoacylase/carboxypeptidase family protein
MNLQHIVSRTVSPLDSGVVSITKVEAGDAFNVIPASALLRGTIRALSTDTLLELRTKVERVVHTTASTYGCNVTIQYSPDYYPPTVNDVALYEAFSSRVARIVSATSAPPLLNVEPTMGAEDFSFVAETIPSTFFLLGQGGRQEQEEQGSGDDGAKGAPTNFGLHHPHFNLDESVLSQGVELHVNLVLRALRKLQREEEEAKDRRFTGSASSAV